MLWEVVILCLVLTIFWPPSTEKWLWIELFPFWKKLRLERLFIDLGMVIFNWGLSFKVQLFWFCTLKLHFKNRVAKALERFGKVCYNEHPRGRGWCTFWVLEEAEMWLSKVSRRAFKSNAISNIFIRFCIRCNYLYGAWLFRFLRKWKGWKPLIRLGFQPLLSSVKVWYFPLKSEFVKRLENRLPKRHGGSNPSSCAKK